MSLVAENIKKDYALTILNKNLNFRFRFKKKILDLSAY
jgi:hypothetical protein